MSTLQVTNILSNASATPPSIRDSSSTEIATFCRAWVNFNGTGTVAIRGSFNVSSITDNGTGNYTVNFTNALSNTSYSAVITPRRNATNDVLYSTPLGAVNGTAFNTGSFQLITFNQTPAREDAETVSAAFFI